MELVEQNEPPALIELLLARGHTVEASPGIQQFRLTVVEFSTTIVLLGTRLRSVGAAMVFQVEFTDPARQMRVIPHALIEFGKIISSASGTHTRKIRQVCHELQTL